jgi:hypothetical protein
MTQSPKDTNDMNLVQEIFSEEERTQLLLEVSEVVYRGVMRKVWNALDVTQQDALHALVEESNEEPDNVEKREAVTLYIKEHVPLYEKYLEEESQAFLRTQEEVYGELSS